MKKLVTITLAIALMSTAANAAPSLDYTAEDIGGGLTKYVFTMYGNDGLDLSFGSTNLTFTGAIHQIAAFGGFVPVHDESNANGYHVNPPAAYNKNLDTWMYDGWAAIAGGVTDVGGWNGVDSPVVLSVGSGTATYYQQKDLIQIIAGGEIGWSGIIARDGNPFDTSGTATLGAPGSDSIQILTPVQDDHPGGPYPVWETTNIGPYGDKAPGSPPYGFAVTVDLSNAGAGVASYLVSLSIDGGTTFAPLQSLQDDISPDGDGAADGTLDIFLSFAELAAGGATDRTNGTPYYIRVEAMDDTVGNGGGSPTGEISEIEIHIPEPATMGLMLFGAIGLIARKRRRG
ncbi:MAG: PEP-CTERM sorting domain-containing protein [Phycisphaerae bacterium]|jgi:hypothetical protein|nr:PEP-CTERM sorting domain-containing protein [Phycisphaerae bacterium]